MGAGCGVEVGAGGAEGAGEGLGLGAGGTEGTGEGLRVGVSDGVGVADGEAVGLDDAVAAGLPGSGEGDAATGSDLSGPISPPNKAPTTMAATPTAAAEVHLPAGVDSQPFTPACRPSRSIMSGSRISTAHAFTT